MPMSPILTPTMTTPTPTTVGNYVPKPFDIDGLLGIPKNRVVRVGVELEGAWSVLPKGARLEKDMSVFKSPLTGTQTPPAGHQAGELPIGPMQVAAVPKFMRKYYPQKVNETCGLHVHMSFDSVWHYSLLMDTPEYQDTVLEYLTRWAKAEGFPETHHFYPRLRGNSAYCQIKFWPDAQINSKKDWDKTRYGHRYTAVHYCGRQRTIEVRVLPMMETVEQGIRAVRHVVDITNAVVFLLGRRKEQRMRETVEIPSNEVYEEFVEEGL